MSKFSIGDIVAFQTHPFNSLTNDIVVSGEYQMIPPIMVIVEVIPTFGVGSTRNTQDNFKCLWFSTKENSFKENYFSESDLKNVSTTNLNSSDRLEIGNLATLKTMQIELGKKRSFLNNDADSVTTKTISSISGLLTFIPPVMSVLAILPFNSDSDKKTSPDIKLRKIYPVEVAKCKWFDSVSEKFCEKLFPLNALIKIPEISDDLLKFVDNAISKSLYIFSKDQVFKPHQISNRSGFYYVTVFNYISRQFLTIPIDEIGEKSVVKPEYIKEHAPVFKASGKKGNRKLKLITSVEDLLIGAMSRKKQNYVWIKYKDQYGMITQRTLSQYEIIDGKDYFEKTTKTIKYLRAFCHLRKANRSFLLTNVIEAIELDLNY